MAVSTTELLTGALVVITGAYAALTYGIMKATGRSAEAMQRQLEALTRPYVTVSPLTLPNNIILFLRIANTGRTAAQGLRLSLDRSFHRFGDAKEAEDLATFSAFREEIASFAPGAELVFALAQAPVLFGPGADHEKTPVLFGVSATYSFADRTVVETTQVDLRPYLGMHTATDPLVDELRGIRKALGK